MEESKARNEVDMKKEEEDAKVATGEAEGDAEAGAEDAVIEADKEMVKP